MKSGMLKRYSDSIGIANRLFDLLICFTSAALAYVARFDGAPLTIPVPYLNQALIAVLLMAIVFPPVGLYHSWRAQPVWAPIGRALTGWMLVFALLLIQLVLLKRSTDFSRLWLAEWFLMGAAGLVAARIVTYSILRALRERGYNLRRVVVIGSGSRAIELMQQMRASPWAGFTVEAMFDEHRNADMQLPGLHRILPLAELEGHLRNSAVDEAWICLPIDRSAELKGILRILATSTANVRYVPDFFGMFLLNHGITDIGGIPMIDLSASPMQGLNRLAKVVEDKLLTSIILILVSPLMLILALGVKLSSPGPVFYTQERMGWNGRVFRMLKFRTMPVNAEAASGPVWARKDDSRSTWFGGFLRRNSLDELPQFLNVLMGDMSIVGPRPERPVFVEQFKGEIQGYMQKHMMKAGITGWAQANGWRGNTDLRRRIEHDLYYINNWSLWLDMKIIMLTILKGLRSPNAY